MAKHLDIRSRVKIQIIIEKYKLITLSYLAKEIGCSPQTIQREIQTNRIVKSGRSNFNGGSNLTCLTRDKFPYVCNNCIKYPSCTKVRYFYDAYIAEDSYQKRLRETRRHPQLSKKEMKILDNKVSNRVKDHQSLYHILQSDPGITISESTLRRYVNNGYLSCMTMDLPMTIRFKVRNKNSYTRGKPIPVDILNGRTYLDYTDYCISVKRVTVQLDLVIGKTRDKKAILTIYDTVSKFQWAYLVTRSAKSINNKLSKLIKLLQDNNCLFFDSILTDNGAEFQLLPTIEMDSNTGKLIFKTFYCNPYASYQKGGCERNHSLFRRFYSKGYSFDFITQQELDEVFSQINSLKRKSLKGKTPFQVFSSIYGFSPTIFGVFEVPPQTVKIKK